jgi:hypothetical protein
MKTFLYVLYSTLLHLPPVRHSYSTVSEDAGTGATLVLAVKRSNHSAISDAFFSSNMANGTSKHPSFHSDFKIAVLRIRDWVPF